LKDKEAQLNAKKMSRHVAQCNIPYFVDFSQKIIHLISRNGGGIKVNTAPPPYATDFSNSEFYAYKH
jgi:hypothetical protein